MKVQKMTNKLIAGDIQGPINSQIDKYHEDDNEQDYFFLRQNLQINQ